MRIGLSGRAECESGGALVVARITVTPALIAVVVLTAAGSVSRAAAMAATLSFVQARANEVTSGASTGVTLANPTTAGNLIVEYVLWNNAGSVTVSDNRGDPFAAATSRTTWGSSWSGRRCRSTGRVGG